MRKILAFLLCLVLIFILAACNSTPSGSSSTSAPEAVSGGKTLVVYFSASGNTERVANAIAAATGGDTFSLEPVTPYTDADLDWTDDGSRVNYEHDNEDARAIELTADTVDNWAEYDTIYIGYPIWWGIAAWPVDTFIKANDFTGKTVIPFCTSSSSRLGESGQLLADMAGTGDWQEGQRFQSSVSDEDVAEWVNTLYGTTTMLGGFSAGRVPENLPDGDYPMEDYAAESDVQNYIVSVDPVGVLAYLRQFDISYLFAGKENLDCALQHPRSVHF